MTDLDERVIRKVFGATRGADGRWERWVDGGLELSGTGTSPVSTDISAAWLVVERMRELGWRFSYKHTDNHFALFDMPDKGWEVGHFSNTAPLAICLAALEAVK